MKKSIAALLMYLANIYNESSMTNILLPPLYVIMVDLVFPHRVIRTKLSVKYMNVS